MLQRTASNDSHTSTVAIHANALLWHSSGCLAHPGLLPTHEVDASRHGLASPLGLLESKMLVTRPQDVFARREC